MKNICDNCKFWKNPKTRGTMQFWYGDCSHKESDRYETKTDEFFSCNYFEARDFSRVRFTEYTKDKSKKERTCHRQQCRYQIWQGQ